jgi:uncharacterized damage-inducible protein DinB
MSVAALQPFYEGWARHQALVIDALLPLTPEQLALRTAPHQWAVWQLSAHVAGSRACWFNEVLGEGDPATRDLFRVDSTTVTGMSLEDAGWEDDEDHPRSAEELVVGLRRSWAIVDDCLGRWTAEDLAASVVRPSRSHHRGWVVWHVMEHDIHHGGEVSQILGSNGLPGVGLR